MKTALRSVGLVFVAVATSFFVAQGVHAANPANFNPGRIIDDEVFYSKDDMSVAQIQAFLDAHVPACDTWGTGASGYGNLTKAQYAQQIKGWPGPPYACLDNYHENPTTGETSFEKGGGAFAGGISSAQIIYNASQQYGINPKVLMVLLRKESLNLFSDSWPLKSQYKYAMGYACPDSGPNYSANCDTSKAGFYKQMMLAAWQLRYYYDHMGSYSYTPGRWNTILYNPNPACGTKEVFIENHATASLYIYTPYTPNNAALYAYPGEAWCGAYGNRNFWFMWQEWFGSTYAKATLESNLTLLSSVPGMGLYTDDFVEASFIVKNNTSTALNLGSIAVACRDSSGGNCDFPAKAVTLQPGQSYLYRAARKIAKDDKYSFWITSYVGGQWNDSTPSGSADKIRRYDNKLVQPKPTLTQNITVDGAADLRLRGSYQVNFKVRNNSTFPLNVGNIGLGVRSPSGKNVDMKALGTGAIPGNSDFTYSGSFVPREVGNYTASIIQTPDFRTWNSLNYIIPSQPGFGKGQFSVRANPTVSQNLTFSTPAPRVGDSVDMSIRLKNSANAPVAAGNIGVGMRDPQGKNVDLALREAGTLASGAEFMADYSRVFKSPGTYTYTPISYTNGQWTTPPFEDTSQPATNTFTIKPNVTLTQGLTVGNQNLIVGDILTGSFKVKNFSSASAVINKNLCYIVRGPQSTNLDLGCLELGTLAPGEEKVFSVSKKVPLAGAYSGFFSTYDGAWKDNVSFPGETGSESKSVRFEVKSNPVLSQGLAMTPNSIAGQPATGTFKVKNMSDQSVKVDKNLCYIVRGGSGNNDLGCLAIGTLAPGEEVTYSKERKFAAGEYTAFFSMYDGKNWYDNRTFGQLTGSEPTSISFTVKTNPVLVQGMTLSSPSPILNETVTGSFKIKNMDTTANVVVNKSLCYIVRGPGATNYDLGCLHINEMAPGQELTFSAPLKPRHRGEYTAFFSMYDGKNWYDNRTFGQLTGSEPTAQTFTVR